MFMKRMGNTECANSLVHYNLTTFGPRNQLTARLYYFREPIHRLLFLRLEALPQPFGRRQAPDRSPPD